MAKALGTTGPAHPMEISPRRFPSYRHLCGLALRSRAAHTPAIQQV